MISPKDRDQMLIVADKRQALEDEGYAYSFDRLTYVNRVARKAFSVEFVQDHNEAELRKYISEPAPPGEWQFYFNSPPSDAVKRELAAIFK